jgi:hypothetical protein
MPEGSQATKAAVKIVDAKRLDQSQKAGIFLLCTSPPTISSPKDEENMLEKFFF